MALRILIVDDRPDRAAILRAGLPPPEYEIVGQVDAAQDLRHVIETVPADIVIASLSSPGRDTLEDLRHATSRRPKPIVMFVDQAGAELAGDAVRAGVAAYIVDGLQPGRVRPIVSVAIARFEEFQRLRDDLERSRAALVDRKLVDRAKGILMQEKGLSEADAYALLRSTAMRQNQKLAEVARSVLAVADLFGPRPR